MARCRNKETHIILESGESESQKTHHRVTKCMTIMEIQNTNVTKCMPSMEIQNTNVTKCMTSMEIQNTNVTKCMRSMEIQNTNVTKCMTIMEIQNTNVTKCMTSMEIQNTNVDNENIQHKPTHFAEKATTTACEMCEHFSLDQCSYHRALKFKLNYN